MVKKYSTFAVGFAAHVLLISFVTVVFSSDAFVSQHYAKNTRAHKCQCLWSTKEPTVELLTPRLSPESSFWAAKYDNLTMSSSGGLPAISGLARETGPLPPGAYHDVGVGDERVTNAPCHIAVGIQPPLDADEGGEVWREGVKNCQKLIDSGFNTFKVNGRHQDGEKTKGRDRRARSPSSTALEKLQQITFRTASRHDAETNFYQTLRRSTPSSILRSCHFMVNLEVPSILSDDFPARGSERELSPVPFGNGWMVRESISNALKRTKGECLDTAILEYRENSPYHLDVLSILSEMQYEGVIQSISTQNFPPSLIRSARSCGFNIRSNTICGNLMNTNNLQSPDQIGCSNLISAPLAGGLFTNNYSQFREWAQMPVSGRKVFRTLMQTCCDVYVGAEFGGTEDWKRYRKISDTLLDMSVKYQVSLESIALRWLLQLNHGDSICVATQMGMDFVEEQGGKPYSRHRNLREVFTFSIDEADMQQLNQVSGSKFERNLQRIEQDSNQEIDFTNKALWI